jgi:integrase
MRLPHHLLRQRSGTFHFRLIVPPDLHGVIGKRVIKKSLGTKDPAVARLCAYALGARYAEAFAIARVQGGREGMGRSKDDPWDHLRGFEIEPRGDGYALKTNGTPEDNAAALKALDRLMEGRPSLSSQLGLTGQSRRFSTALDQASGPTLEEALSAYAEVEAPNLRPNTWVQRERACTSFLQHVGGDLHVSAVTRPMAAKWAADLQRGGLSKRYVANQVSHVAQLFDAQIRAGHIADEKNPVKGVVTLKGADKKLIRASGRGWEPFELDQLERIFDPQNFKRATQQHTRWGALIGLYSGARVGEIAQIHLRDFVELDGIKCVYLTDDNDGASLKNDQSRRLVPLHPDLLTLGLWQRVERLRQAGEERLFPSMKIDGKSGAGNAISKGFSYLLNRLAIKPRRAEGTVGFHSLRKNVIQQLQGTPLPAERRRALVGHESGDDIHGANYMREWTAAELAEFFPGLPWAAWLDVTGLTNLLS